MQLKAIKQEIEIEKEEETGVTTYVNQWRFRSSNNEVMNLEFYFNYSNNTGNETLRKFLHVAMCLSLIEINLTDLDLDAVGMNRRFVRYLSG